MANVDIYARWRGEDVKRGAAETANVLRGLAGVAAGFGVALGLNQILTGMKAVIKDTAEEERGLARMAASLRNVGVTGKALTQINEYIGQLQDSTQFADDAIVAAFTRMSQATGDAQGSLAHLTDAMDVAAATGKTLEESGQIVAMAMEGQVRALGQLLPSLKTYLENLEGVEDPAKRSALALQAMRDAFGGAARADLDSFNGSLDAMKHSFEELGNTIANKSGVLKWMKEFSDAAHVWAVAIREGITLAEAGAKIEAAAPVPKLEGVTPPKAGGAGAGSTIVRGAPITESIFGEIEIPANNRQRGSRRSELAEMLKKINGEVADDYTERMKAADRAVAEAHRAEMHALGESLKSSLMGAFDAATQGGKAFVDYLKNYFKQALVELAAGGLINALIPGAGVGMGILGKIFSHGASSSVNRNLTMRSMRLG